jgi:hypothetical protein
LIAPANRDEEIGYYGEHLVLYAQPLKEHTLWSDGHFAASIGQVSAETIKYYIENRAEIVKPPLKGRGFHRLKDFCEVSF